MLLKVGVGVGVGWMTGAQSVQEEVPEYIASNVRKSPEQTGF